MKKQQTATLLISDEIEIILNEQTKIKILVQIIFGKADYSSPFVLDVIEHTDTEIYYYGNKLANKYYKDEESAHKKFIQFNMSIGIDINEIVDNEFENWEKAKKNEGYFDNLLHNVGFKL